MQLNPHETWAIDLRKLRDAQKPDSKKNKLPAAATDGSVMWVRQDNLPVMGRLMLIHRQQGMASSYDYSPCPSPNTYVAALICPGRSRETSSTRTTPRWLGH